MDRNLVLAILLSVLIIVGFQFLYQAIGPHPLPKKPPETQETMKGRPTVPPPERAAEVKPQPKPQVKPQAPERAAQPTAPAEEDRQSVI
jgi:outer membrane biosynthesis protein TonB